ncbi:MAG: outer membrane beta-barrel protein [Verrucomicrobiota bacterium]
MIAPSPTPTPLGVIPGNPFTPSYNGTIPGASTVGPSDVGTPGNPPALIALPANPAPSGNGPGLDASTRNKFYTFSVSLRETYDSNVNTTQVAESAWETSISPSVLIALPMTNGSFTASYTFGLTYYDLNDGAGTALHYSNELLAQYAHDISERFSLAVSESLVDSTEPNLYAAIGTPYRNGENISNSFTASLNSQWTPLLSTTTSYANDLIFYLDTSFDAQTYVENTGTNTFNFSVLPTVTANIGGFIDEVGYGGGADRGYMNYTGFVGGQWQVLPSLSVNGRGGATLSETDTSIGGGGSDSVAPYVALSATWSLGARSTLDFSYAHEITPTDQIGANSQQSDRISTTFSYQINSAFSTHLSGIYTYSTIGSSQLSSSNVPGYNENDYAFDTGATYHFQKYLDLDVDIGVSGVSSELADRDYSRDQFTCGIRGTY